MAAAAANPSFVAARRRLFTALFASAGVALDPSLARRRPGRTGSIEDLAQPANPDALNPPRQDIRWLTRATFGFTIGDDAAYLALGASDDERWPAWIARQLAPATIDDSGCDGLVASAGYVTLNKTANQLWNDHHAVTNDYYTRMLPVAEVECMTLVRQIYSQRQLFEVMVDFWHDHFSVFGWDYDGGPLFPPFDALFRDLSAGNGVFGNFKSLLMNVCKSASMMYMLDLYSSTAAGPNENYARELCELHTLGAMNYAGVVEPDELTGQYNLPTAIAADGGTIRMQYVDNDVYQVTSALSGWTLSGSTWPYTAIDNQPLGAFAFDNAAHYKYQLFFLNRYIAANTGMQGGEHIFDWLAAHPGVARFIATKLCRRLVGDNPSATLVDAVATVFSENYLAPNQLQLTTQAILTSAEFLDSWGQKMKRPGVAAVGALRALAADFTPVPDLDNANPAYHTNTWTTTDEFMYYLQGAGHRPFYWPAPNGYPDVQSAWASTGTLGMSLRMLGYLVEATQDRVVPGSPYLADIQGQTLAQFPNAADRTGANIAGFWCDRILGWRPAGIYAAAVDLLRQNAQPTDALDLTTDAWHTSDLKTHYTKSRLRSMVALILCSPEFLTR
jgi:uncharacterized protein (DUF1800 family)